MVTQTLTEQDAKEQKRSRVRNTGTYWNISARPHRHIHMKMRAVHGQKIQGGEPYERAGGHKIEVAGVGEGKIPEDHQRGAQDGNKKVRQVKIFLILGTSTLLLL